MNCNLEYSDKQDLVGRESLEIHFVKHHFTYSEVTNFQ